MYIDCTTINQNIANDKSAGYTIILLLLFFNITKFLLNIFTYIRLLEQWKKDKTVEHFIYQDDICLELLLLLKKSTSCLPASKKYMNDFLVGFMDMNG